MQGVAVCATEAYMVVVVGGDSVRCYETHPKELEETGRLVRRHLGRGGGGESSGLIR